MISDPLANHVWCIRVCVGCFCYLKLVGLPCRSVLLNPHVMKREKNCSIDTHVMEREKVVRSLPFFSIEEIQKKFIYEPLKGNQTFRERETNCPCMALCLCYACFCRSLGPVSLSTELTKSVCLLVPRRRNQMALPRTRQHLIQKKRTRQQGLSCPDSHTDTDTQVFLADISCKHWLLRKRFLATTMCYPN